VASTPGIRGLEVIAAYLEIRKFFLISSCKMVLRVVAAALVLNLLTTPHSYASKCLHRSPNQTLEKVYNS
jgi:hypothetical protein